MTSRAREVATGRRRAVLLGCGVFGLRGCDTDVTTMEGLLRRCGFDEIEKRTGPDATRAGVLDAVAGLIAATRPGDAALVYWSGHGGRVERPDSAQRVAAGLSPYYQFLVPFDFAEGTAGGFAGLLSEEVTALQWRLTDAFLSRGATPNVTTVLDCCHAGYLARDAALRPRALSEDQARSHPLAGIGARADEAAVLEAAARGRAGMSDTNAYAVRLVAAQPEQSAFERDTGGATSGVFTTALAEVLSRLLNERGGCDVPWSVVGELVRTRVQAEVDGQRPAVEGPGSVLPFSPERAGSSDALPVTVRDGRLRIEGAQVLGIRAGDQFALRSADGSTGFGEADVERVEAGEAVLRQLDEDPAPVREGVRAVPRRLSGYRRRVRVDVPGPSGGDLAARVRASARLAPAEAGEQRFATVAAVAPAGLRVLDELGAPVRVAPLPDDLAGRAAVVDLLEVMARGRALTELGSGAGDAALTDPVDLSFGAVRDGVRTELPRYGARVPVGERLSLRIGNLADRPLFFWLFDVGVSLRVSLVTNAAPTGTRLAARGEVDGTRLLWGAEGAAVTWPDDVPVAPPGLPPERAESFIVVLADRPQDLGSFVTARAGERGSPGPRSELELALDAVRIGVREMPAADAGPSPPRYRVERISFFVTP
jgi:hypothetical protein